jgi:hypothetical protein
MRLLILGIVAVCHNALLRADDFYPEGSDVVFSVTPEILAQTPAWNPLAGQTPVSAADAIRIAAEYHKKIIPSGRTQWYVFDLAGASLVRSDNDRWYWVVQYRAYFDPEKHPSEDGKVGRGWIGPKITHNRYPVLFDGKLAPSRPRRPKMPAAIRPADNNDKPDLERN